MKTRGNFGNTSQQRWQGVRHEPAAHVRQQRLHIRTVSKTLLQDHADRHCADADQRQYEREDMREIGEGREGRVADDHTAIHLVPVTPPETEPGEKDDGAERKVIGAEPERKGNAAHHQQREKAGRGPVDSRESVRAGGREADEIDRKPKLLRDERRHGHHQRDKHALGGHVRIDF